MNRMCDQLSSNKGEALCPPGRVKMFNEFALLRDERANCPNDDDHGLDMLRQTRDRSCYGTTAFFLGKGVVNGLTVSDAVMTAWETIGPT